MIPCRNAFKDERAEKHHFRRQSRGKKKRDCNQIGEKTRPTKQVLSNWCPPADWVGESPVRRVEFCIFLNQSRSSEV